MKVIILLSCVALAFGQHAFKLCAPHIFTANYHRTFDDHFAHGNATLSVDEKCATYHETFWSLYPRAGQQNPTQLSYYVYHGDVYVAVAGKCFYTGNYNSTFPTCLPATTRQRIKVGKNISGIFAVGKHRGPSNSWYINLVGVQNKTHFNQLDDILLVMNFTASRTPGLKSSNVSTIAYSNFKLGHGSACHPLPSICHRAPAHPEQAKIKEMFSKSYRQIFNAHDLTEDNKERKTDIPTAGPAPVHAPESAAPDAGRMVCPPPTYSTGLLIGTDYIFAHARMNYDNKTHPFLQMSMQETFVTVNDAQQSGQYLRTNRTSYWISGGQCYSFSNAEDTDFTKCGGPYGYSTSTKIFGTPFNFLSNYAPQGHVPNTTFSFLSWYQTADPVRPQPMLSVNITQNLVSNGMKTGAPETIFYFDTSLSVDRRQFNVPAICNEVKEHEFVAKLGPASLKAHQGSL